jgi:hypothetical protein
MGAETDIHRGWLPTAGRELELPPVPLGLHAEFLEREGHFSIALVKKFGKMHFDHKGCSLPSARSSLAKCPAGNKFLSAPREARCARASIFYNTL